MRFVEFSFPRQNGFDQGHRLFSTVKRTSAVGQFTASNIFPGNTGISGGAQVEFPLGGDECAVHAVTSFSVRIIIAQNHGRVNHAVVLPQYRF